LRISVFAIDSVLDILIRLRKANIDLIKSISIRFKEFETPLNSAMSDIERQSIVETIINAITKDLGVNPLSQEMKNAPLEMLKSIQENGFKLDSAFEESRMKQIMLGEWSSLSLLFLSYFTFAHESYTRYPDDIERGETTDLHLGCYDYTPEKITVVARLGRLGYITQLTLNEIRNELPAIRRFFSSENNLPISL
jgi:hypothetical protein